MTCTRDHSDIQEIMKKLPIDQGGDGRHKCAACAYNEGYAAGLRLDDSLLIDKVLKGLDYSQAGAQRHRSPRAAFALGYYKGVCDSIRGKMN